MGNRLAGQQDADASEAASRADWPWVNAIRDPELLDWRARPGARATTSPPPDPATDRNGTAAPAEATGSAGAAAVLDKMSPEEINAIAAQQAQVRVGEGGLRAG